MKLKRQSPDTQESALIPGALLAAVCGDPQSRALRLVDESTLRRWNERSLAEVVEDLQSLGFVTSEQGAKLLEVDRQFRGAYEELTRRFPEISEVTGCDAGAIQRLARALMSARLFGELLEILTPPQLSYEKRATGTVDLLSELFDAFRRIVGGHGR